MKKIFATILALLFATVLHAQTVSESASGSGGGVTPVGTFTAGDVIVGAGASSIQDGGNYLGINLTTYGAKCDGVTDDAAAINTAFAVIRTALAAGSQSGFKITGPTGTCLVKSTLNWTAFRPTGSTLALSIIDLSGIMIHGQVSGAPIIDATNSRFVKFENFGIWGDCTTVSNVGIQFGNISTSLEADRLTFDGMQIDGCFTQTAMLNSGEEDVLLSSVSAWNESGGDGATTGFAYIADGYNHFNLASAFGSVTKATDTYHSFNDTLCIKCDFRARLTGGIAIWIGGATGHQFVRSYSNSYGTHNAVIYTESGGSNSILDFGMHFEATGGGAGITSTFFLSGSIAAPSIDGFRYYDEDNQSATSVFGLDGGSSVTSFSFTGFDINIAGFNTTPTLFDAAASYTVSGNVVLNKTGVWNTPASFNGCLSTPQFARTCSSASATNSLVLNGDFNIDQIHEGASYTSTANATLTVDRWRTAQTANSKLSFARSATSPPTGYNYSMLISTVAAVTLGATDTFDLHQSVEGPSIQGMGWGATGAKSVTVDWCAKANNSGQYSWTLENGGNALSWVHPFTIAGTSTWQCYSYAVPGPTSSVWTATPGGVAIIVRINTGQGSNKITSSTDQWVAADNRGATGDFELVANSSATLNVTGFRIIIGGIDLPYVPLPYGEQMNLARRYYQKSFPAGTAPAQNAGVAGATCLQNPIAAGEPSTYVQANPILAASPTIVTFNPSATNANWRDVTAGADTTVSVDPSTAKSATGFEIATGATVTTLADNLCIHWTADSGL